MHNSLLLKRLERIKKEIDSVLLLEDIGSIDAKKEVKNAVKEVNKNFLSFLYRSSILKDELVVYILSILGLKVISLKVASTAGVEYIYKKVLSIIEYDEEKLRGLADRLKIKDMIYKLRQRSFIRITYDAVEDCEKDLLERIRDYKKGSSSFINIYRNALSKIGEIYLNFPFFGVGVIIFLWAYLTSGILTGDVLTIGKIFGAFKEAVRKFFVRVFEAVEDSESFTAAKIFKFFGELFLMPFTIFSNFIESLELEERYLKALLNLSFVFVMLEIVRIILFYFSFGSLYVALFPVEAGIKPLGS